MVPDSTSGKHAPVLAKQFVADENAEPVSSNIVELSPIVSKADFTPPDVLRELQEIVLTNPKCGQKRGAATADFSDNDASNKTRAISKLEIVHADNIFQDATEACHGDLERNFEPQVTLEVYKTITDA